MLAFSEAPHRKNLSTQVMEAIEKLILDKKLVPGDILPTEQQISQELQVSKSSVREAIKMMEALGIVDIRRGLCTVISERSERGYLNLLMSQMYLHSGNIEELRLFRQIIEKAYTAQAIAAATDQDIEQIGLALERFRQNVAAGQLTVDDDIHFHDQVLAATHNSYLITLGAALNQLFRDSIETSIRRHPDTALSDHERIYQAICQRRPDLAAKAIEDSAGLWSLSLQ